MKINTKISIITLALATFNTLCFAQLDTNAFSEKFKEKALSR